MRRRSLRLGITTLLSATLLGGATPAVAYEMQRESATSLRIILDSGEKIEQNNAAAAILAIATQRKEALVADGILSQDKADAPSSTTLAKPGSIQLAPMAIFIPRRWISRGSQRDGRNP